MQGNNDTGLRGDPASAGPAHVRNGGELIADADLPAWAWLSLPRPSPVYIAFWMMLSACVVILGIAAARNVSLQGSKFNVSTVLSTLLQPAVGNNRMIGPETKHLTGKLKSRSSFATESAFRKSQAFETARIAGSILPLALYCKDRKGVALVKTVLGTVTGKDPYHAEVMAIGWLARHRDRLGYRPTDCSQHLPKALTELRSRF